MFLAVMLFMSWQETGTSAGKDIPGEATTELIINQPYEDRLNYLFRSYFDPSTYLVSVKSTVSLPVLQYEEAVEVPSPQRVRLPGLPVTLGDAFGESTMQYALDQFILSTGRAHSMMLSNEITIWASKDYDDASLDFMRKLANTALLLQPERGDRIRIIRYEFPQREKEKDVVYVHIPEDVTTRLKQDDVFDVQVQRPSTWTTIPVHTLIAIGLIILLLILLGIILYYYRKQQQEEPGYVEADDETIVNER